MNSKEILQLRNKVSKARDQQYLTFTKMLTFYCLVIIVKHVYRGRGVKESTVSQWKTF